MIEERWLSVGEMAEQCGLSSHTLRWYEREGMIPPVTRVGGRRRYSPAERDLVLLLTALRETGMPVAMMRSFVGLMSEGAASHGRRAELLAQVRALLDERRRKIDHAADTLERKIRHYEDLIDAGLDCDGAPVAAAMRPLQAARA